MPAAGVYHKDWLLRRWKPISAANCAIHCWRKGLPAGGMLVPVHYIGIPYVARNYILGLQACLIPYHQIMLTKLFPRTIWNTLVASRCCFKSRGLLHWWRSSCGSYKNSETKCWARLHRSLLQRNISYWWTGKSSCRVWEKYWVSENVYGASFGRLRSEDAGKPVISEVGKSWRRLHACT